ncbi:hypothetical protein [Cellulosilyticum ruminicola]|uniref:hypothetical protein n=1 Tax=Cellulosilyticum ruminicola TaxID=425254 RepID=UPI001A9A4242|nr:hypothetical protein [Cellulosilyticum ruminicola]
MKIDRSIPPIGYVEGIDLVTEGVLTIGVAIQKLERLQGSNDFEILYGKDVLQS